MKGKTKPLVGLVLAVALLTALVPATGLTQGNKTYFTGEECEVASLDPVSGWNWAVASFGLRACRSTGHCLSSSSRCKVWKK